MDMVLIGVYSINWRLMLNQALNPQRFKLLPQFLIHLGEASCRLWMHHLKILNPHNPGCFTRSLAQKHNHLRLNDANFSLQIGQASLNLIV